MARPFLIAVFCLAMVDCVLAQHETREYSLAVHIDTANDADLVRADAFIEDGQIEEAVDTIQRVLEEEGDKLLAIKADEWTTQHGYTCYVPARELCHLRFALAHRIAPKALAAYRQRVDPLARRWYEDAVKHRDSERLQRLVDQMFVSQFGDDALFQLSELAIERGQFAKARGYLERIDRTLRTPSTKEESLQRWTGRPLWLALRAMGFLEYENWDTLEPIFDGPGEPDSLLAYPDTSLELADVRARLVLISILESNLPRAEMELALLKRLHPDAEGRIAGKDGIYHEQLKAFLETSRKWTEVPASKDWPTFTGSFSRIRASLSEVDIRISPLWQTQLLPVSTQREFVGFGRPRVSETSRRALSYHPIVVGDLVLWNTSKRILAHRLRDSQPVWGIEGEENAKRFGHVIYPNAGVDEPSEQLFSPARQHFGTPRYTMSAHRTKVFARLGDPLTGSRDAKEVRQKSEKRSVLVGIDLTKEGKLLPDFPIHPDKDVRWEFEGAPISDGSHLYVAMRHTTREGAFPELHVACYTLPAIQTTDDASRRPPLWRTRICNAETPAGSEFDEITHVLLTMNEGTLYCNTNMGAVAAIEPERGQIKWLVRYPRSPLKPADPGRSDLHYFRDLNPCLCYKDLVIVAPTDCDRIFALDSMSGRPIWENTNTDAVHLLGVGNGNLIASGLYLYWIDVFSGKSLAHFPTKRGGFAKGLAKPTPIAHGRGVLAGGQILWPTAESIFVFDQTIHADAVPRQTRQPIRFAGTAAGTGNLVVSRGMLLIAAGNQLYAFKNDAVPDED